MCLAWLAVAAQTQEGVEVLGGGGGVRKHGDILK